MKQQTLLKMSQTVKQISFCSLKRWKNEHWCIVMITGARDVSAATSAACLQVLLHAYLWLCVDAQL